jgi:hypothetical protein
MDRDVDRDRDMCTEMNGNTYTDIEMDEYLLISDIGLLRYWGILIAE